MTARVWPIVAAVAIWTLPAAAQLPQASFRTRIDRVRVDAFVTDRGRPVTGLTARDFEVKDNGVVVPEIEVASTSGSLGVAMTLALSGGAGAMVGRGVMAGSPRQLVRACDALANALEPGDRAWLITFDSIVALKAGPVSNADEIHRLLAHLRPGPGMAMWDALFGAVSLVASHPGRSVVMLFASGTDTSSWLQGRRTVDVLRRSDVIVNAVQPPYGGGGGTYALEAAAKATGGVVVQAESGSKLNQQFVDLLGGIRQGYVLSYAPPELSKDGWHKIEVRLKQRRGNVRVREGYYETGR